MTFTESIKACFHKYAVFSGRASRSELWWFVLFTLIFDFIPFVNIVASFVFFLPNLAVACRRLHDMGKSGWWLLVPNVCLMIFYFVIHAGNHTLDLYGDFMFLVFIITVTVTIWLLVEIMLPGKPGSNKYGNNPLRSVRTCPNCKAVCWDGDAFCPKCGFDIRSVQKGMFCPSCNHLCSTEDSFCLKCGTSLLKK